MYLLITNQHGFRVVVVATAQAHGLTVVSCNVADFQALGVTAFNPFAAKG